MQQHTRPAPASFLKHASDVATFYGFRPLRDIERRVPNFERRAHSFATAGNACVQCHSLHQDEPVLAYWASHSPLHLPASARPEGGKHNDTGEFGLNIIGVPDSIAEVVLLKTVATVITEWGATIGRVRLNALGDKDSKMRFEREVSVYLRKHANSLHDACRERLSREPMAPYNCADDSCKKIVEGGPRAMNFLSEKSRLHFKEVLELSERLALPYEFDDLLMGDEREPRMLFAFDLKDEDATVLCSTGGRFDDHFRTYLPRREVAGVSASIYFRKKGMTAEQFKLAPTTQLPSVYFIQIGLRAKIEGLSVVDVLRRAQIPVLQSFDSSKFSPQFASARAAGVSHLLIMGQREALDGTILVRTMDDSRQTIVGLTELPRYLKNLR